MKLYFIVEMISTLFSYYITKKNKFLVGIHFIIHLFAISHIFNIFQTLFYKSVFNIAYNNLSNIPSNIPNEHRYLYNIGVIFDICSHIYNIKFLYQSINNKKS